MENELEVIKELKDKAISMNKLIASLARANIMVEVIITKYQGSQPVPVITLKVMKEL
jgi:hypothetical protein